MALDHDLIFSCVDRPWPRAVLNSLAYSDLIPVIDGGIAIDAFGGGGMRNATWRSHVVRPGRPCMSCNRQLDLGAVAVERQELLDDPGYIRGAPAGRLPVNPNVAPLSVNVAASLLAQYVSFSVAPGGLGDPGPLQYALSTHYLEHRGDTTSPHCAAEAAEGTGDRRVCLTGLHREGGTTAPPREVGASPYSPSPVDRQPFSRSDEVAGTASQDESQNADPARPPSVQLRRR